MRFFRDISKRVIIKIILLIIVISIIITSIANFNFIDRNYIVKINGKKINYFQLEQSLAYEIQQQKNILGEKFYFLSKDVNYIKNLRYQVLSNIIDETLIDQYVKNIFINISDKKIQKNILNQSIFYTNNKFDNKKYLNLIQQTGFTINEYIEEIRKKLTTNRFLHTIINTDFILNDELKNLEKILSEKRIIKYKIIKINNFFNNHKINDKEIILYYQNNIKKFKKLEKFIISYINVKIKNVENNIHEQEIKKWYDKNKIKYLLPQKKYYSIIECKSFKEAQKIIKEIKNNVDFYKFKFSDSVILKKYKECVDLPIQENEIKKANLSKKGEISKILQFKEKYLIIKLEDIKKNNYKKLSDVHDEIKNIINRKKSYLYYVSIKEKIMNLIKNKNINLEKLGYLTNLKIIKTKEFDILHIPNEINKLFLNKNFFNLLFKENEEIKTININATHSIFMNIKKISSKIESHPFKFYQEIIKSIQYKEAVKKAELKVKKIIENIKNNNFYLFNNKKILSRNNKDLINKIAFSLSKSNNNIPSYGIVKNKKGDIIILILEKIMHEKFSVYQKQTLKNNIIKNNLENTLEILLNYLRKNSSVIYNTKL